MDLEDLIKTITEAFDGVPQPERITIHVAEAHDEYDYEHDDEHRQKDFIGRWQDVPHEHIQRCQTALSYVDSIGMRFYLPAYMVWYLLNLRGSAVTSDHTLYSLNNHPNDPRLLEYHIERFALFNPRQLKTCALFVKYCAEDESGFSDTSFAHGIYKRYWSKFEQF